MVARQGDRRYGGGDQGTRKKSTHPPQFLLNIPLQRETTAAAMVSNLIAITAKPKRAALGCLRRFRAGVSTYQ